MWELLVLAYTKDRVHELAGNIVQLRSEDRGTAAQWK